MWPSPLAALDHHHVARLIEALCALAPGQISQERQDLAGLRPVDEVLGMPDRGDADRDAADATRDDVGLVGGTRDADR